MQFYFFLPHLSSFSSLASSLTHLPHLTYVRLRSTITNASTIFQYTVSEALLPCPATTKIELSTSEHALLRRVRGESNSIYALIFKTSSICCLFRDPNIFLQTVPANNFFPANNHFPVNNPLPANTSGFLVQPVSIVPSADSMFIKELPHQGNFTFLHFGGEIVNPFNPTFSPQSVMHLPKAAAAPGANVQPLKPDERNEHSLRLSQSKIPVPGSSMVQSQENMPLQTTTIKSEVSL